MAMDLILPLRAIQLLFNIIVLGLIGYVVEMYADSPSQVSFILFTSIWTFIALAYLTLAPLYLTKLAHGFALLAIEILTMLFWFAGFIALAVYTADHCPWWSKRVCGTMKAAAAFAAFEWLLWTATTVLLALKVFRSGASSTTKPGAAAGPTVAV